jgi:pimeloyl-ACP methyl ester carboxylesterase
MTSIIKFCSFITVGFGVGTFHYENQLKELSGYQIYSFDLLGQGQSWPDQDSPSIGMYTYIHLYAYPSTMLSICSPFPSNS